ncbi:MAG TPA: HD domain-containing phosphohydrolase [Phycisphaerae bacterium]|nr:HD domain-containing phosphohydrolase [Phycisphaerae bacterium]
MSASTAPASASEKPGAAPPASMNSARPSAARAGYLPIPLDRLLIDALSGIPIYLHTGAGSSASAAAPRFTLYSSETARFSESHRARLHSVGVKFVYIPVSHHSRFQTQVEEHLISVATDPAVALNTKAALVYETSMELINEVLSEQDIAKNLPRLGKVSHAISTLVMKEGAAFSHLFATAQHDFYTATHMVNVGTWMTTLAFHMGIEDPALLNAACTAGMVHDVGKLYVPETVLNKTSRLSDDDWDMLRDHPTLGHDYLVKQGVTDEIALRVCLEHHERIDGTGYPHRIPGEQMHHMSRICAVVDSFDAMTACRPFRNKPKSIAEAVKILREETPSKYDKSIVDAWISLLNRASHEGSISEPVVIDPNRLGRRRHTRFAIDTPVRICTMHLAENGWQQDNCIDGRASNISEGGLHVVTHDAIPVSACVRIMLNGSGTLQRRVMEGKIVRCRPCQNGTHELGIQFCTFGAEEQAAHSLTQGNP